MAGILVDARALFRHAPTLRVYMLGGVHLLGRVWHGAVESVTSLFLVGRTRMLDGMGDASNKLGALRGAFMGCIIWGGGGCFVEAWWALTAGREAGLL